MPDRSRITTAWLIVLCIGGTLLAVIGVAALVLYSGVYNVAADVPHTQTVYRLMDAVRERSIASHAKDVAVPGDLADATRIAAGAGLYAEMCSLCHLAPGMKRTEISRGLYPRAPELRRGTELKPAEEFWVVKHGIKMTAMPAWGLTHSDDLLWDLVAFLRKLTELTPDEYEALVRSAPSHQELMQDRD
jgi:mono/diheme cytochrome c family protein